MKIKDIIFTITHPSYWVMNYPYSEIWDAEFNKLLDSGEKFIFDKPNTIDGQIYHATIGGNYVWIQNIPYACFVKMGHRPSRITIRKALRILMQQYPKNII